MLDFSDVKHLLFKGFVPQPVTLAGIPLVLKSLSPAELEIVLLSAGSEKDRNSEAQRRSGYVARAIWMLDGRSVLPVREDFFDVWADWAEGITPQLIKWLYEEVHYLNMRAAEAFKLIEPFAYTAESRMRWRSLKGQPVWSVCGIEGSASLGVNSHQEFWSALNAKEDLQERFDTQYGLAKFIVSPHISKQAANQLKGQDEFREKESKEYRQRILDQAAGKEAEGPKIARTTEELLDQMNRWVKGEKDEHDLLIEKLEQGMRDEIEEKERLYREYIERAREAEADTDDVLASSSEVVSADEMERRMKEAHTRRQRAAETVRREAGRVSSMTEERRAALLRNMDSATHGATPVDTKPVANPRGAAYTRPPAQPAQPRRPQQSKPVESQSLTTKPAVEYVDGGTSTDPDETQRRMRELGLLDE